MMAYPSPSAMQVLVKTFYVYIFRGTGDGRSALQQQKAARPTADLPSRVKTIVSRPNAEGGPLQGRLLTFPLPPLMVIRSWVSMTDFFSLLFSAETKTVALV